MRTGKKNTSINTLLLVVLPLMLHAQYTRTYKESFAGIAQLDIINNRGNIDIKPSSDGKTSYELRVSLEANSEADANVVFDAIMVHTHHNGSSLTLETDYGFNNIQTINGRTSITFNNRKRVKNLRKFEVAMVVYTGSLQSLSVAAKYHKLTLADGLTRDLNLNLNSSEITLGSIPGHLNFEAKYTKGQAGNTGTATLNLYDCDLSFQQMGQVELESKYSELEAVSAQSLKAETFDDDISFGTIFGDLNITDKYSELDFTSCGNSWLDLYDAELNVNKAQNVSIKSKYTDIEITDIQSVDYEISYDDDIRLGTATTVHFRESKYSDISIEEVKTKFAIESYDDNIRINAIGDQFEGLSFHGKYSDFTLDIPTNFVYRFRASTKYGELDLEKGQIDFNTWIEKSSALQAEGKTRNANDTSPLFLIEGDDNNVRIQ